MTETTQGDGTQLQQQHISRRVAVPPSPLRMIQSMRRRRTKSLPPKLRKPVLEDHFRVEKSEGKRLILPGMIKHDENWQRDMHDLFNLIVLLPIIVLNVMNWNWEILLNLTKNQYMQDAWHGDFFFLFYWTTISYFVADLAWIFIVPNSVKSPAVIIQHHVISMIYLLIPYYRPERRWFMGACMSVELNTWFLIARRVFNKQGFPPWTVNLSFVSFKLKFISICFYVTWFSLRCFLYPVLLVKFINLWMEASKKHGTFLNNDIIPPILHSVFCILNLKWTIDLMFSKYRYFKRRQKGLTKGTEYEKGL